MNAKGTTELDVQIGKRIAALRKARGLSQHALGEPLGISFQQVQKYERGVNRVALSRAAEIAERLGVRVQDLLGTEPETARLFDNPRALQVAVAFARITDERLRTSLFDAVLAAAEPKP